MSDDTDRETSAYLGLSVSDECSDAVSEPRSEQAGVERTLLPRNRRTVAELDDQPNVFVVARHTSVCYGIGETTRFTRQHETVDARLDAGVTPAQLVEVHRDDTEPDATRVVVPIRDTRVVVDSDVITEQLK